MSCRSLSELRKQTSYRVLLSTSSCHSRAEVRNVHRSQSTDDMLSSVSTLSKSSHLAPPRTVSFAKVSKLSVVPSALCDFVSAPLIPLIAFVLSPLKKLHGERRYGDEENAPGSQSFSHARRRWELESSISIHFLSPELQVDVRLPGPWTASRLSIPADSSRLPCRCTLPCARRSPPSSWI